MAETSKSGALFVDFENVFYALLNDPFGLAREDALSAVMDAIQGVRKRFGDEGVALIVERSYADWDQIPSNAQRQLQIVGVLPRYADSRRDKNTADIELSLDVLQHLLTQPESQHIVLVGGDRDYLPILRRVKERHRNVWVCSLRNCLSGDVRDFVKNYSLAQIIELDDQVNEFDGARGRRSRSRLVEHQPALELPRTAQGGRAAAATTSATAPPSSAEAMAQATPTAPAATELEATEWHDLYLQAILRFLRENDYSELHLSPFFRWLGAERVFELVSVSDQRRIFTELKEVGAIRVEERNGHPYPFSVAVPDWNHPWIQRLKDG